MGKLLKYILWLLVSLLVLLMVAVVVLPLVIDPNDYKAEIATAVEQRTGRTLTIEGDIDLSVFPWLGMDIGPTRLSNAAGFDEPAMARMEAVQVKVKLLPLLHQQVEVNKVHLSGLELYLAKDEEGRTNWADLTEVAASEQPKDGTAAGDTAGGEGGGLARLSIGGIEITDASIHWDDRSTDSRYEVNDLSLTTGPIVPGEAFDLQLQLQLVSTQPAVDTGLSLDGEWLVATDFSAISVTDARLQLDAQGDSLPAGQVTATLSTDVSLGLATETLMLPNIVLETLGLQVTGSVSGTHVSSDKPRFSGNLVVAEFVPRKLLQALGEAVPETADDNVLGKADLQLAWDASPQHFAASTLTAHLDETTISGDVKVKSFEAPAITFALTLDQIDIDAYLPPADTQPDAAGQAQTSAPDRGAAGQAVAQQEPLPLESLRQLDLNGVISIGRLKAFKLRSRDVEMQIEADGGVLEMSPLTAHLYDGAADVDLTLDARKDTPRFSVKESLTGVQAGPLLKDLTGDDRVLGTANVKASLSGLGNNADEIVKTLNGSADFSFQDGAINGVNIAAVIREAKAVLDGTPPPPQQPNRTDFAILSGSAKVKDGLVKSDDLLMKSPLLRISGAGEVNLPVETIDYTLTTKFVGSLEGQGGQDQNALKGVAIPVYVAGTFSQPTYTPDLAAVAVEAAKTEAGKRVQQELQKKLGNDLGKDISDHLLKGLFD